jgi:hypothetical protein
MSTACMPRPLLDLAPHLVGPRLGAEDADLQRRAAGSTPWRSISSRIASMYDGVTMMTSGSKSGSAAPAARSCRPDTEPPCSPALRAVVRAEPAGEQPVAVGDVHDVARPPAGARIERAISSPSVDVRAV